MIKASFKFLSCMVFMAASVHAATLPGPHASAHIEVDRQGQLLSVEWFNASADLNPSLREAIEAQLRGLPWEIDPAQVKGSRFGTNVAITSSLEEDGSDLVLSLDSIYVGPAYRKVKPPRYPSSALRAARQSEGYASVTFSDEGIPADITYSAANDEAKAFREVVTETLKGWVFKPETVDGIAVSGSMTVPLLFSMNCSRNSEHMTGETEPQTAIVRLAPVLGLKQRMYGDAIEITAKRGVSRWTPPPCKADAKVGDR